MKKLHTTISLLFIALALNSCSKDDPQTEDIDLDEITQEEVLELFADRESSCDNTIGYTGAYWDFVNEINVLFPETPTLANPGSTYSNSELGIDITIPEGLQVVDRNFSNFADDVYGIDIINADQTKMLRWIPPYYVPGQYIVSEDFMVLHRFYLMTEMFGLTGDPLIICSSLNETDALGYPREINTELIEFNGFRAQIWTQISYLDEGTVWVSAITLAPVGEFDTLTKDVFLPLEYQLYMESGLRKDQDGDGYSYLSDIDDNDSSVPSN